MKGTASIPSLTPYFVTSLPLVLPVHPDADGLQRLAVRPPADHVVHHRPQQRDQRADEHGRSGQEGQGESDGGDDGHADHLHADPEQDVGHGVLRHVRLGGGDLGCHALPHGQLLDLDLGLVHVVLLVVVELGGPDGLAGGILRAHGVLLVVVVVGHDGVDHAVHGNLFSFLRSPGGLVKVTESIHFLPSHDTQIFPHFIYK